MDPQGLEHVLPVKGFFWQYRFDFTDGDEGPGIPYGRQQLVRRCPKRFLYSAFRRPISALTSGTPVEA